MRLALLTTLLLTAFLSGCVVEEAGPTPEGSAPPSQQQSLQGLQAGPSQGSPTQPATQSAPHGEPQVVEGPIETGVDPQRVPGAYARQTTTVTNGFGDIRLGDWTARIAAGHILVQAADRDGYLLEATRETSAATEAEARAMLDRTRLNHTDQLQDDIVRLATRVDVEKVPDLVPGVVVGPSVGATNLRVTFLITLPTHVAMRLSLDSASGDLTMQGLHGQALQASSASGDLRLDQIAMDDVALDTASGDITARQLASQDLQASAASGDLVFAQASATHARLGTSSGDIAYSGAVDNLAASSSSGDIDLEATAQASGVYELDAASGSLTLDLRGEGRAYRIEADTASGDIAVDVPDGKVIQEDERHLELESKGYASADLRTEVLLGTSSGDIAVDAQ